jgi:tRNA G18 (ribose-2'-O)-methylase SpoU
MPQATRRLKMPNLIQIDDFNNTALDVYARLSEAELLHYYEPNGGIFIAESPLVIGRALDAGYEPISMLADSSELGGATENIINRLGDVPIYTAPSNILTQLTGFKLTRGALCAMRRKALPSISHVCQGARRIVVLEAVVNPTNVGAIFRSAAALNMDGIILSSGCSNPLYRRAARVSMGTVFQIPWTIFSADTDLSSASVSLSGQKREVMIPASLDSKSASVDSKSASPDSKSASLDSKSVSLPAKLREMGFSTAAMALREDSVNIDDQELCSENKLAIFLGSEGYGLTDNTIDSCDYTVCIPMTHGVDSLNVAAASAVAFWQLGR